ncbi:hypothetical protein JCM11491_001309 [Sporobolomyces phaffii]
MTLFDCSLDSLLDIVQEHTSRIRASYQLLGGWLGSADGFTPEYVQALDHLVAVATSQRVLPEGYTFESRRNLSALILELNNLAIAAAFLRRDFSYIRLARRIAAGYDFALPDLDFDSMDAAGLELVKVEVPEQEWFALTLRDKVIQ